MAFAVAVMIMALFFGSTIAQSPAASPTTTPFAPTPSPVVKPPTSTPLAPTPSPAVKPPASAPAPKKTPLASAPSPVTVNSPPSPPEASPAPATPPSTIAGPPSEVPAPAPSANSAALNRLTAGCVAVGLLAVALVA